MKAPKGGNESPDSDLEKGRKRAESAVSGRKRASWSLDQLRVRARRGLIQCGAGRQREELVGPKKGQEKGLLG